MQNQINAIAFSGDNPEDIIVSLDGDDWFNTPTALQIIVFAYENNSNCWMTYGSWISTNPGHAGEMWPAYPEGLTDFRNHRWLATAVRTWKRWLWDILVVDDFTDDNGNLFRVAEDRAIMLPMLEMSGTDRAKHIAEPLMVYNQLVANEHPELEAEAELNVKLIASRDPYKRLKEKIIL